MLSELCTHELSIFTRIIREAKDPYTARKLQKDRLKVKHWIDTILNDREVIIFYLDSNIEKMVVGTCKKFVEREEWPQLPAMPLTEETVNGQLEMQEQHVQFWEQPTKNPISIHVDSITKFITMREGLVVLSNKMQSER